jgi:HEAT repeat protein
LVTQFQSTTVFWKQFEIAKQLARTRDRRVLSELEPWLGREDRHVRGNAAFVFASLGDPRGFETLQRMLIDRSDRPLGQGMPTAPGNANTPKWWVRGQIQSDRYYAVHLFGELKDPRAVSWLLPLLDDPGINYKIAWALGEIGDRRAIRPLMAALRDRNAHMRVSAIHALVRLQATEALPRLLTLQDDRAVPNAGDRLTVGETAKGAIAKLRALQ